MENTLGGRSVDSFGEYKCKPGGANVLLFNFEKENI